MKYNKGFIGIGIIIAIIAALVVGGGAVYFATKTPTPPQNIGENNYQPQESQNSLTTVNDNRVENTTATNTIDNTEIKNNSNQEKTAMISSSSKDKGTGVTYSKLTLEISPKAISKSTEIGITSLSATEYDKFIGGYYVFTPLNLELLVPATISITYNDSAVSILSLYKDISSSELTLAYYDLNTYKYIPIKSTFDRESKTVTGEISKFYEGGFMIIKKP